MVKNLPMQETSETQVRSLGQEEPLEEEMATHSSMLAWRIPWTEEPGRFASMGSQRVRYHSAIKQQQQYSTGNSTQYSVMTFIRRESKQEWIYVN